MADLNNYCRLCLCKLEESAGIHIMTNGNFSTETTLIETVNRVFPFKIEQFDGFSQTICAFCDQRVADITDFIETTISNQKELRRRLGVDSELLEIDISVKQEFDDAEFLDDDDEDEDEDDGEEEAHVETTKRRYKKRTLERCSSPLNFECDFCQESFRKKVLIEEHMLFHSQELKPDVVCLECPAKFFTAKQMRRHLAKEHPKQGTVNVSSVISRYLFCELCQERKRFKRFQDMTDHMEDEHETRGYAVCCEKKFYGKSSFRNHVDMHVNPVDYLCTICNKLLPNRRSYREHIVRHQPDSERKHQCDRCNKKFFLAYDLRRHIAQTHDKSPEDSVRCEECDRT